MRIRKIVIGLINGLADDISYRLWGYDMATERIRAEAMEHSIKSQQQKEQETKEESK